jgi:hypothetical protein
MLAFTSVLSPCDYIFHCCMTSRMSCITFSTTHQYLERLAALLVFVKILDIVSCRRVIDQWMKQIPNTCNVIVRGKFIALKRNKRNQTIIIHFSTHCSSGNVMMFTQQIQQRNVHTPRKTEQCPAKPSENARHFVNETNLSGKGGGLVS